MLKLTISSGKKGRLGSWTQHARKAQKDLVSCTVSSSVTQNLSLDSEYIDDMYNIGLGPGSSVTGAPVHYRHLANLPHSLVTEQQPDHTVERCSEASVKKNVVGVKDIWTAVGL